MVEKEFSDNSPQKRYLITKGELPVSAGGGKASTKEKIVFVTICVVAIILIVIVVKYFL